MNELLRKELIRDEGKRLKAYKDTEGNWTIGIGHYLGKTPRMIEITDAECEALYRWDVWEAERIAEKLSGVNPAEVNDVRRRALTNMAFNLGNRLGSFKNFLSAVNQSDWEAAGKHMLQSKWAGQVGKRAERLRDMIVTGVA